MTMMQTSPDCTTLCHYFEQLRLKAYADPASPLGKALAAGRSLVDEHGVPLSGDPWTNGWGQTGPDIHQGTVWTQDEADARYAKTLAAFEALANAAITVSTSQNQFDAFVCALYNIGPGGVHRDGLIHLANGQPSTMLRRINAMDFHGAWIEFPKWDKAGGVSLLGLRRRRAAEQALFGGSPVRNALAIGAATT